MRPLLLLLLGGCAAAGSPSSGEAPEPPNIIFILVDDLGWKDLGCTGSSLYRTPHIDRLASEGMKFTVAYAAAPVCSPTRASILTGRYPARVGITGVLPRRSKTGLALEERTIAELLKASGYATGSIGKWHLGGVPKFWPERQGFDVNFAGTGSGMPAGFFWPQWKGNPPIVGNATGENLTDRLSAEAVGFIEAHARERFFLYLSFYAVHIPIEAKKEKVARYRTRLEGRPLAPGDHFNPVYAGMVETVDDGVGRVAGTLRRLGIDDRTVIVFFSDNGGLSIRDGRGERMGPATSNLPLRAGKGFLYEGGIREPCIIRWPGVTPPGSVCRTPIVSVDFFPTLAAIAGADRADLRIDGLDLTPLLHDPLARFEREAIYWHYPHYDIKGGRPGGVVRAGKWKLIERYDADEVELFDLEKDEGETTNLSASLPDRTARLRRMLESWRRETGVEAPKMKRRW